MRLLRGLFGALVALLTWVLTPVAWLYWKSGSRGN